MQVIRPILYLALIYCGWIVVWQLILAANLSLLPRVPWFAVVSSLICWWLTRTVARLGSPAMELDHVSAAIFIRTIFLVLLCISTFAAQAAMMHMPATAALAAPQGVSPLFAAALSVLAPTFSGIVEEVGFRGVVQRSFVSNWGTTLGIGATTILFVSLHFWNPLFTYQWAGYLVMSLALGYLALVHRSLVLCVVTHASVNLVMNMYVVVAGSTPTSYSKTWLLAAVGSLILSLFSVVVLERRSH